MRRRKFIKLIAGAAAALPLKARAQRPATPVIGFLRSTSPGSSASILQALRRGLGEAGYVEGQNATIEYRWAEGHFDRLPTLAEDLIQHRVAVIVANLDSALAAKAATVTIPIVFVTGSDPVKDGLVASLNKPGGNVTGVSFLVDMLGPKKLELARELVPNAATIAVLVNANSPAARDETEEVVAAANSIGQQTQVLKAGTQAEKSNPPSQRLPINLRARYWLPGTHSCSASVIR
jgi:putative ABC transport system substrate-binding protein